MIRRALASETPPEYSRAPAGSKLDPFRDWICEQHQADPMIQSLRLREMAADLGYLGGKTIFDDYVREIRPRFLVKRTFQRTIYRPGELVQCDLWDARAGHGRARPDPSRLGRDCGAVLVTGDRRGADLLQGGAGHPVGLGRCLERIGALPEKLVWDREGAIHASGGRPTDAFAGFCGQLDVGWIILDAGDAQAKGVLERSHRFMRTNFEPGGRFANPLDFQLQLDGWCDRANGRVHRTIRAERLVESAGGCSRSPSCCPIAIGGSWCGSPSSHSCAGIAATNRSTRRSPGAASRSALPKPRSWRSCWTPASSRAGTAAASPAA